MPSPAEMPHADEALKSLVARFKHEPADVFIQLSAALLARGHATEALRIAEHGLQMVPTSVEGRIERAASLLALGRPRVAYVELRRALAIDPSHRRGMRLLGKAYVESGAPHRAAGLLAMRSMNDEEKTDRDAAPRVSKPAPPPEPEPELEMPEPEPLQANDGIPDMFSSLTQDLGLGAAVPESAVRRVEVTQIIRRKGLPRPPRSASELVAIEGPIIDTTQPGQIVENSAGGEPDSISMPEPAQLLSDRANTDQFSISGFNLDDEPLFQEDMPFEVRPVEGDRQDLFDEPASRAPTIPSGRPHAKKDARDGDDTDVRDTRVDLVEENREPLEDVRPSGPSPLNLEEERPSLSSVPVVEKKRAQPVHDTPNLEVVDPKPKRAHVILAISGAAAILIYTIGLLVASYDTLEPWFPWYVEAPPAPAPVDATARRPTP